MSKKLITVVVLSTLSFVACQQADAPLDPPLVEGVSGVVLFWEGNHQPGTPTGTKTPVERDVLIYEPTTLNDVTAAGNGFYLDISTRLVVATRSSTKGRFAVALPAGRYSVFVREQSMLYTTRGDMQGTLNPVDVTAAAVTEIQFDITYQASF